MSNPTANGTSPNSTTSNSSGSNSTSQQNSTQNSNKQDTKGKKSKGKGKKSKDTPNPLQSRPTWFIRLLRFMLLLALGIVALFNIQPYIGIMRLLMEGVQQSGFFVFLLSIPHVGLAAFGFASWLLGGLESLGGFILWFIFQSFQLLPTIVSGTQQSKLHLIRAAERAPNLKIRDRDNSLVRHLKKSYNSDPANNFRKLQIAMAVSYVVDIVLCGWHFGVIQNWGQFDQSFSLKGLLLTAITVSAFQTAFGIFVTLRNTSYMLRGGKDHA
jgi:hypothetical protein